MTLSAMVLALLNVNHHWAIVAALLVGGFVGAINGWLVVGLEMDSLIATLGTSTFVAGVVLWISGSNTISGISQSLVNAVVGDQLLGIPLEFY